MSMQSYRNGMLAATVDIVKKEGPSALLSGLGPTVVGYGVEGAMKVRRVGNPHDGFFLKFSRQFQHSTFTEKLP